RVVGAARSGRRAGGRKGEDLSRCGRRHEIAGRQGASPDAGCRADRLNARRARGLHPRRLREVGTDYQGRRGCSRVSVIPICSAPREPTRPRFPPPPDACDTHAHVFGPTAQFPYAADRSYTPPEAPMAKYLAMLDTVGCGRGVLVQGSAHGHDNAAMLNALAHNPDRLRGVAVADATVAPRELRRWHEIGVRG